MTPVSVTPSNIEKELLNIWESMKSTTKIRSCLFNLVIFTKDPQRSGYFKNITQKLINNFPCRAILIVGTDAEEEKLETKVSVISPSLSHGFVVCDLIEIEGSKSALERIPSITLPHLLPDLPVYFVWAENPTHHDPICYSLEKVATRIIFDSESSDDLSIFAKEMLEHHEKGHFDIADLNWARLEGWRDLIANSFTHKDKRSMLPHMKQVTIFFNSTPSQYFKKTKIQSLFLQAWLASQLGWKVDCFTMKEESITILYSKENQKIEVNLLPEKHPTLWAGAILGIEFTTDDKRSHIFRRNEQRPQEVEIHYSSQTECYLPSYLLFTKTDSGQSLAKEISHQGTSSHYIKVLQELDHLHKKLPCN